MTGRPFEALQPDDFEITYRSGVVAPFELVRAALPALRRAVSETGDASVVNIASMYAAVSPDRRLYAEPAQQSPFQCAARQGGTAATSPAISPPSLGPSTFA